ncbi:MAG: zf-HC2 domain-containing protein [Gaiellaceae bacterium]
MLTPVPPTECMGARESASARLDGELSELEAARLDGHLRDCAECRAYAGEIGEVAGLLRAAALERPGRELSLPRQPYVRVRAAGAAAAAAAVLVAAAGASLALSGALRANGSPRAATSTAAAVSDLRADSNRQQHLLANVDRLAPPAPPRDGTFQPV